MKVFPMRTLFCVAMVACFLLHAGQTFGQSTKKQTEDPAPQTEADKTVNNNGAFNKSPAPAPKTETGGNKKKSNASFNQLPGGSGPKGNARFNAGFNRHPGAGNAGVPGTKMPTTEEQQAAAKKKYAEIFASKKTYEVRLRNKSVTMKKGKLIGTAMQNGLIVFESNRAFIAVPADSLYGRLEKKLEGQLKSAKEYTTESGIAFDDVNELPEDWDLKMVGVGNREKIKMYMHKKDMEKIRAKAAEEKMMKDKKMDDKKDKAKTTEADK